MPLTLPSVTFDATKTIIPRKSYVVWTPNAGIAQVETITCAGNATSSADATVTVTGTGISGSPVAVTVPLTNGDTPYVYAKKIRAAIAANAPISAVYRAGGAGLEVTLTKIVPAANVTDLAIAIAAGTTGITAVSTSINTVPGVAATAVELIGKVVKYGNDMQEVEREVPDEDGLLRPDRIVAISHDETFLFELEDINRLAEIFGGLQNAKRTGTVRVIVVDPDDAAGTAAVASNTVAATVELDGGLTFNAGEVAKATLKFTPLAKVTMTADEDDS
jgi:hypothetical protein